MRSAYVIHYQKVNIVGDIMKQYSLMNGSESAVPVFKRKQTADLNKARSALLRSMYALDEAINFLTQAEDTAGAVVGRRIVGELGQLRERLDE